MEKMNRQTENQLKQKRIEAVLELGEFYYKKLRQTKDLGEEEIQAVVGQIAELDLEIAKVTGTWMTEGEGCPNCGEKIGENSAFCSVCGFSIKDYMKQFIGNCKRCGAKVKSEQNFCDVCGMLLKE